MKPILLGVMGPWQLMILLGIVAVVLIIIFIIRNANKNNIIDDRIDTTSLNENSKVNDSITKIEKLHKMYQDGILTKDEFEKEKSKILNQ